MKAYKARFQDAVLVISEDMKQPEGFTIAEECYPGFWSFGHNSEPQFEMIPVSHEFLGGAEPVGNFELGRAIEYSKMSRKEIQQEFQNMIEKINAE